MMNQKIDAIYTATWDAMGKELSELSQMYKHAIDDKNNAIPLSAEKKKNLYLSLISDERFKNPITALEAEHHYSFQSWVIEKFHERPTELYKHLRQLNYIRYNFQNEPGLIFQICPKPKALEILQLVFENFPTKHIEIHQHSPFLIEGLSEELFAFLLENHEKFCKKYSPLSAAIENNHFKLLDRILRHQPEWTNVTLDFTGYTALMLAILRGNDEAILRLLENSPDLTMKNRVGESIAHLFCKNKNESWQLRLIQDPRFEVLQPMIRDPNLQDNRHQIPLHMAIFSDCFEFAKHILTSSPELKKSLMNAYAKALYENRIDLVDILHEKLELYFNDDVETYTSLVILALQKDKGDWIEKLSKLSSAPKDALEAVQMIHFIYQQEMHKFIDKFKEYTVNWNAIPPVFCMQLTLMLLILQRSDLIAELKLFDTHVHFSEYQCDVKHKRTTFIDHIINGNIPLSPEFISYFFDYLDRHPARQPHSIFDFHPNVSEVLQVFPVAENPHLLHDFESFLHQHQPKQYQEMLKKIMVPGLQINELVKGRHLFARILEEDKVNGFERIRKLKNDFRAFRLDRLDTRGSNLLHLATEFGHLNCIRWSITQNLDILSARASDGLTALDIALDKSELEILNVLRKQIKKSQFIDFLQSLIVSEKHKLIDYFFNLKKPFDWDLTPAHLKQLESLSHPKIHAFLNPKKPMMSHEEFIQCINNKPHVLIQAEHQESFSALFAEHFELYLALIFQSPNHVLHECFTAQILQKDHSQRLHQLFKNFMLEGRYFIIANLLKNPMIQERLQNNAYEYCQIALTADTQTLIPLIFKYFDLSSKEQEGLLELAIEQKDIKTLESFLSVEGHLKLLNIPSYLKILSQGPYYLEVIMSQSLLKQHFLKHSTTLFLEAISQEIQPVIDLMLRVESLDLHNLLRKAIADINIPRIEQLLAHSEIKAMIEHHHLEYFHIAITAQAEELLGLLLKHFKLNDQAFAELLDLILHQQNPRLLLAFLKFEDNFRRVDVLGWLKVLSQEPDYLEFILSDSNIQNILSQESKACFNEALKHNNFDAIDSIMRQPCTREQFKKIDANDILAFQANPSWPVVYAKWQQDPEFSFFTHPAFFVLRQIASLPPLIQLAFNTCLAGQPNASLFLIGSAVHRLIQGLPVETLEDFDFVSNQPPRTDEISGFRQDRRIHPLFRRALTSDIRIEYYVAPHHSRYFILDDYSRRDFTVNALYCSRHGEVFDPTGRGIDDLNHRVIRSIHQPDIAFHNNPILLLRAIRLMAKGFTPDHDVHFAMLSWSPDGPINYGHIFAMAKTMLKSSLGLSVFMILNEYQLLSKLLNFIWEPIFENVLDFVEETSDMYNSTHLRQL